MNKEELTYKKVFSKHFGYNCYKNKKDLLDEDMNFEAYHVSREKVYSLPDNSCYFFKTVRYSGLTKSFVIEGDMPIEKFIDSIVKLETEIERRKIDFRMMDRKYVARTKADGEINDRWSKLTKTDQELLNRVGRKVKHRCRYCRSDRIIIKAKGLDCWHYCESCKKSREVN